jgi:two-component system chemotaxis sensor kinase CheA
MMNNREVESSLHQFSLDILQYEDGDLMFVSDLIDKLHGLRPEFPAGAEITNLFSSLDGLFHSLLKGAAYRTIDGALSRGFDLLSQMVALAVRENVDTASLTIQRVSQVCGADLALFTSAAAGILAQAGGGRPSGTAGESRGNTDLELRIASEPFKVFLSEAEEKIIHAQDAILELEKDPADRTHINELFRIFHTIKGECGFLHIVSLGELAHNLENLLDLLREGKLKAEAGLIDLLLSGVDHAKQMLSALRNGDTATFSQIDVTRFIDEVNAEIRRIKTNIGVILLEEGKLSETEVQTILQRQKEMSFTKKFGEIAVDEKFITQEELDQTLQYQASPDARGGREQRAHDSIIKVKASQINYLVDMVGELLITEAQLDERVPHLGELRKITREIQFASMQLRTERVKNLLITMKRIARDAARNLTRRITVEIRGEDLEIDRDLVEKLEEPLMHLVRNAVAHGVESEEERLARGKQAEGRILIQAERRGNTIVIAVEDDGRGLNREVILAKAVERNLVSAADAAQLTDNDAYGFIFRQGFSTAANVDLVSGRGVGMDIVKAAAEAARGRVELKTARDEFTRVELVFPLSTAIIDGMIVNARGTSFIIPVSNVVESLSLEKERVYLVKNEVEVIDLRQEIIPVIRLGDFFGLTGNGHGTRTIAVIVENNDRKKMALLVDEIVTKREVFIKALGSKFKDLRGISSGTILQGGAIGFVLDIDHISRWTGLAAQDRSALVSAGRRE